MTTTQTTVTTLRNQYKALMAASLRSTRKLSKHLPNDAEWFNHHVTDLMHEIADGEETDNSPSMYVRCAEQVAFEVYGVDYRNIAECK